MTKQLRSAYAQDPPPLIFNNTNVHADCLLGNKTRPLVHNYRAKRSFSHEIWLPNGQMSCTIGRMGSPSLPMGHHARPMGRRTCQMGRHTCPTGRHSCPMGRHSCPTGRHACPLGRRTCPMGSAFWLPLHGINPSVTGRLEIRKNNLF